MSKDNLKQEGQCAIHDVSTRTFRFADWVNGKHSDETFKAVDRDDAIRIMNEKYPNHEFALAQELF